MLPLLKSQPKLVLLSFPRLAFLALPLLFFLLLLPQPLLDHLPHVAAYVLVGITFAIFPSDLLLVKVIGWGVGDLWLVGLRAALAVAYRRRLFLLLLLTLLLLAFVLPGHLSFQLLDFLLFAHLISHLILFLSFLARFLLGPALLFVRFVIVSPQVDRQLLGSIVVADCYVEHCNYEADVDKQLFVLVSLFEHHDA